jgi:hypothetical protein
MRLATRYCIVIILTGLSPLYAQDEQPPRVEFNTATGDTVLHNNTASVVFERNVNTYNWIGRLNVDTTVAGMNLHLAEQYVSNIIRIDGATFQPDRNQTSNQNGLLLELGAPLTESLQARTRWNSLTNSDNRSLARGDRAIHNVLGGIQFSSGRELMVTPMFGYRWEEQLGNADRGPSFAVDASSRGISLEGFDFAGEGSFRRDNLDPRVLQSVGGVVGAEKRFLGFTRDSVALGYRNYRREYYALTGNTIERRDESIFSAGNLLDYEVSENLTTSFFGSVSDRKLDITSRQIVPSASDSVVRFGNTVEEFLLDAGVRVAYRSDDGATRADARFSYSERNENHAALRAGVTTPATETLFRKRDEDERTKDNLAGRTSMFGSIVFPIGYAHQISVSGGASILRYDTPSSANDEDRDELLTVLSITSYHRLGPTLELSLTLAGNLSHIVYLFAANSANNNYNRVLRFFPRTVFRPTDYLVTINGAEVLANYTVYDFEDQATRIRSFAYRQFSWIDSTSVELTSRIGLDFVGYLKLYERGQLKWDEFKERTENSFTEKTYSLAVRFSPNRGTFFSVGVRYFSQSRFAHTSGTKVLDSFFRTVGPTCAMMWETEGGSVVGLNGWFENRKNTDGSMRSIANMSLVVQLHI